MLSISFILMCHAALANNGNHADATTDPHLACFFLNIQCSIFPPCSILPRLSLMNPHYISRGKWGWEIINSLRPRLNRRHFADDILKCIFLNENEWILPRISLKFVPEVRINNIPALVQIMAWRRPGAKPLSEPMVASFLTHICVPRPQWVKGIKYASPGWDGIHS